MSSPEKSESRKINNIIIPTLETIIKNGSWLKHSKLVSNSKSVLSHITSARSSLKTNKSDISGVLHDSGSKELTFAESEFILSPIISALGSETVKIVESALDCVQKLISNGCLRGEADISGGPDGKLLGEVIEKVCKCSELGDEGVELLVLKTVLSGVTSVWLRIVGESLLRIVRTSYDIFLDSKNVVNQTTAKASLVQMLLIVFRRMEADSVREVVEPIVVAEMMGRGEKGDDEGVGLFVQGFISKVMQGMDGVMNPGSGEGNDVAFEMKTSTVDLSNPGDVLDFSTDKDMLDAKYWEISMYKNALEGRKGELLMDGDQRDDDDDVEVKIENKLRKDAFLVFRALCKLSMKAPPKKAMANPQLMRGKIVALELLKILLENAGCVFRTSERFLGAIRQYLCVSLLRNSASTLMIIFQLSCSILFSLVSRFRAGLKAEIGVFFPMIVLRVLENVVQPNFQQKMIVLEFLERLCIDSQILVDIFLNYDCDVNSSNIFERMVNGLLKTAQGAPPGVTTSLLPPQDVTMKLEAMKCLVAILKSMGDWMDKQLRIPDPHSPKAEYNHEIRNLQMENGAAAEHEPADVSDSLSDASSEISDALTIEQRRAYKLELQEGKSLFNRTPKKGIEFLINVKKVGSSPEEIADFLKNASGLNKTMIGDYLGELEDISLRVMHAYVDSFDFLDMEFDDAIRTFLWGFRLPGEAQKIDRIMEKFAQHYCKCNPKAFVSADTAYVLAYSVIMLNTDAHNPMVKNKMSADDFIRINHGVDDGKDLPEEYLRSLFERISKSEIKMKEDDLALQQRHSVTSNKILGLDNILNIVVRKRGGENHTNEDLMRQMQEQFQEKARKSESVYHAATDMFMLKFMIEVCWAPMLAAFSVPLDQSDDVMVIAKCFEGFQHAIHVTAVMSMKTHRDAFVTSLAKFTSLHSPADIKQRNIDAIKLIVTIAEDYGDYLQEAWEHILTCVSRFDNLHLSRDGLPPDATFFPSNQNESGKSKQKKSNILPVLKKKRAGRIQQASVAMRRGSYDSSDIGGNNSAGITSEQTHYLVSELNLLEQVGEINRIFARSQNLNSEAIVDFVKALCKISMEELQTTAEPRVFSLTKIVEIAHYNMNRIRLVWTNIWNVLSEFFVNIGCSDNLSIAIFAMDSLRQLSMKFLEREELANYNFQNEFMKPFVIAMGKTSAVEIRELIIRCVSQMVLSRVNNVKSGWKSMFMVFTTAAYDDHKNIVFLAFEIVEKIVRDYVPCITETETTAFTDFVNCLIAFTNNRFNKDISLSAIGFLRLCAAKLAEGDIGFSMNKEKKASEIVGSPHHVQSPHQGNTMKYEIDELPDKEDHLHFWFPLLAGLSELSFDPRSEIRQSALQVLFDTLRKYGHHFSLPLWERVFESALFPILDHIQHSINPSNDTSPRQGVDGNDEPDQDSWLYETCTLLLQLVVDLFASSYTIVNPLLKRVLILLVDLMKRPHQSLAGIGVAAFVRLIRNAGELFSDDKWLEVVLTLKEAANATLPDFSFALNNEITSVNQEDGLTDVKSAKSSLQDEDLEKRQRMRLYTSISKVQCRAAVQLLLIQAITEIQNMYGPQLSVKKTMILFLAVREVASHAHKINTDITLRSKLQELGHMTHMQDPPLLSLENESYQICLTIIEKFSAERPPFYEDSEVDSFLVDLCHEILKSYVEIAHPAHMLPLFPNHQPYWLIPLGSGKKRELSSRGRLVVTTLRTMCKLGDSLFEKNLTRFFPLITSLIRCEHESSEVQVTLSEMLSSSVGPVLLRLC
uniref:brefeldin A-inhibited guanine nucleotide-exchange protein 2-like n=1 Tax=Erigeron canadensis TaxID=72917 RepID=UPI001CB97060|nr:brefeldin A-inhibited guanine nucleotide-exchange protein 2-like [Erigeron canadensis]